MRRVLWLVLALMPACDRVFGLSRPGVDAGVPVDAGRITEYIGPGDYDDDQIPNDVDACPLLANQDPVDTDLDGMPDDCDPDIGDLGRDCIVLFDAWTQARSVEIDPAWRGRPTPWQVGACGGTNTALCQPAGSPAILYFDADLSIARVETEMRISNRTSSASSVSVFLNLAPDLPDISGRGCGLINNSSQPTLVIVPLNRGAPAYTVSGPSLLLANDDEVTLSLSATGRCTVRNERTADTGTVEDMGTLPPAGSLIGLRTVDATAHLHYILAYGKTCRR